MVRKRNCLVERLRQTRILVKKNLILTFRDLGSTLVQILVPIIFVALLFLLDLAVKANARNDPNAVAILSSTDTAIASIPPCILGPGKTECWTVGFSNSNDAVVREIMEKLMDGNGIPRSSVIEFSTESEANTYLFNNHNTTQGVYHILVDYGCDANPYLPTSIGDNCHAQNHTKSQVVGIKYAIQYNTTAQYTHGRSINMVTYVYLPMIRALDRAIFDTFAGAVTNVTSYDYSIRMFPHPDIAFASAVATAGPFIFFAALMFNFVLQVGAVVVEKELKLRESMRVMGLIDGVYWMSWFLVNVLVAFFSSLILIAAGAAFQLDFFLKNDFGTYFLLFFLFSIAMIPVAFMVSTLISTASTATSLGFVIFLIGSLIQFFSPVIYSGDDEGLKAGIRMSQITTNESSYPLSQIYYFMIIDMAIYTALFFILDNVLYMSRPIYFFLTPSYWTGNVKKSNHKTQKHDKFEIDTNDVDPDVLNEEAQIRDGTTSEKTAVILEGLEKTYYKTKFCCINDEKKTFRAVKGVSLTIEQGQLLCMLGHNGAGKSTTIGMMTGLFPPTGGDAICFGHSIIDGMEQIRAVMGVCPQHDILWNQLTAREHLELFANLKGLEGDIEEEVSQRLKDVALTAAADAAAGSFSGGMKRRLSVAIALVGDPRIVFLDEPTTGMDPVSRREVWNLIERVKGQRVTLLTTHSMEEADILGDRIAIMKGGRLASLGTSLRLKNKYGTGYTINVVAPKKSLDLVTSFVLRHFEDTTNSKRSSQEVRKRRTKKDTETLVEFGSNQSSPNKHNEENVHLLGTSTNVASFKIPVRFNDQLPDFFEALESNKSKLGIKDFQISMTTLEEVFIKVAEEGEPKEKIRDRAAEKAKKLRRRRIGLSIFAGVLLLIAALALILGFVIQPRPAPPVGTDRWLEPDALQPPEPVDYGVFSAGIQIGDVLQNSALISLRTTASFVGLHLFEATRPSGSIPGAWQQMQPEPHFKNITVTGMRVSFNIRFLKDDTPYSVYFVDGVSGSRSPVTRFRTAVAGTNKRKIVFGAGGSLGKTNPKWAPLRHASTQDLDFFILTGDTIFGDGLLPNGFAIQWNTTLSSANVRLLSQSTSYIAAYGDNELGETYWATSASNPAFSALLTSSQQAFKDNMPFQDPQRTTGSDFYRSLRWGDAVEIFILDTRLERNSSHIMSAEQMRWLKSGLSASTSTFKLVVSPVPITNFQALGLFIPNSWMLFADQRREIIDHIANNTIKGVLFVSGGARFGSLGRAEATPSRTLRWSRYNVTELCAGPIGTYINPGMIFNIRIPFQSQLKPVVDTWTYSRVQLDPVTGEVIVQFIDENGVVAAEETINLLEDGTGPVE